MPSRHDDLRNEKSQKVKIRIHKFLYLHLRSALLSEHFSCTKIMNFIQMMILSERTSEEKEEDCTGRSCTGETFTIHDWQLSSVRK